MKAIPKISYKYKLSLLTAGILFFAVCQVHAVVSESQQSAAEPVPNGDQPKQKEDFPIEVNADNVEYIKEEEIVKGTGNVVINFKGVRLAADSITVNLVTKDAYAVGNVRFFQGERIYTSESIHYNFETEKGTFDHTKGRFKPFYLYGNKVEKPEKRPEYHISNGYVTTSDYALPDYRLRAKEVHVYPKDKIIMKDIVFEIGNIPVFWVPFWYYPLTERDSPVSVVPGHSGKWGYYLLTSAEVYKSQNLTVEVGADYRSKRGMAGGIDADYNFNDQVKGEVKSYLMRDRNFEDYDRKLNGDTELQEIEKTRYRLTWEHEQKISPSTRLLSELNLQSDKQIIDDFFRREFDEQIQRVNFLDLTRATEKYQMEFYASPRFNSFFDVLERLPEVRFMTRDMQVLDTPLYLKSDIQIADLNFRFDDEDLDFDSFRVALANELSYPMFLWDFFNFKPYVKGTSVYYSDYIDDSDDLRSIVDLGFKSSFRTSRIYHVESDNWNIHGLRHIFEPTMDFKMIRTSVNVRDVYQFDMIDAATQDTAVSFQLRNLIQTKKWVDKVVLDTSNKDNKTLMYTKGIDEVSKDLVDFSLSFDIFPTKARRDSFAVGHANSEFQNLSMLDFFFRRNIALGSPYISSRKDKYISELLFDMKFSPFDWFETSFKTRYDPHDQQIEELVYGLTFFNSDKISWDIYTSFYLGGSTQVSHVLSYRINSDWRLRMSHIIDFERDSTSGIFEYQRYTLIKDLHEWELAFSYSDRRYFRNRDVVDRSFFLMVYLKDFPNVQLKVGN
ncbi:MAG: hypothetical protein AB1454_03500 [Candidatus Auribacterota bacterium]